VFASLWVGERSGDMERNHVTFPYSTKAFDLPLIYAFHMYHMCYLIVD
jgi:hypothetical protein